MLPFGFQIFQHLLCLHSTKKKLKKFRTLKFVCEHYNVAFQGAVCESLAVSREQEYIIKSVRMVIYVF